jgi:general stress protein 26
MRDVALAVMKAAKFPMLATLDPQQAQPRVRPVSPVKTEGFVVHVANLRRYGKTSEIEACPQVELCYLDDQHDQVRITARAVIESDEAVLADIWADNALLRKYLQRPDNPELIIYRMEPQRVRYMKEWALEYVEIPLE